ncbi:MAG: ABC transporter permease [Bacteroidota bacterium]
MLTQLKKQFIDWLPENNRLERMWKMAQVEFKKRYYNDRLGLFWALLNPLFQMGIYFLVFKYIFKSEQENFALFLFCGLIIWMAFTEGTNQGMQLLHRKRFLIENIQFNHLDLFYSHTLSVFIGLSFNVTIFLLLCLLTGIALQPTVLLLPVFLFNLFLIQTGVCMLLATIKIYLRDIVHVWAIALLVGFWGSGIFYDGVAFLDVAPPLYYMNPFVGIIRNIRLTVMEGISPDWLLVGVNLLTGCIILGIATLLFKRFSHKFLETI